MATLTYDRDGDVLLIDLTDGADNPDTEGTEVAPGICALFTRGGLLIGFEITSVSMVLLPSTLEKLP